jgi:Leucyl aminopeptidase
VTGKNIPSTKDQIKFDAIEKGTFYTRDLVSEPGNVLHPDEYARRINSLKKLGLKIFPAHWTGRRFTSQISES